MTCRFLARFLAPSLLIAMQMLAAQTDDASAARDAQSVNTQRIDFSPGGTIYVDGSYGILRVEEWDRAEVAITPTDPLNSGADAKGVRVSAERKSNSELAISMNKRDARMEYEIQVPRDSSLVIHHGVGLVSINGITGDINATCRRGDLILWLPENTLSSIDAWTTVGTVSSWFPGKVSTKYLAGRRFFRASSSSPRRIRLRTHFGGITIEPILTEVAPRVAGNAKADGVETFFH